MAMRAGIKIDAESVGEGDLARVGDHITVRLQVRLNRGDLVQDLSEYSFVLDKREVIAALEYDAGSVEQHKLADQIAADKHLADKDAACKSNRGLRFNKIVPPSAGYFKAAVHVSAGWT